MNQTPENPHINGLSILVRIVKTLPHKPGVYRMMGPKEQVLYVGKAKNLKKRVTNYTQFTKLTTRLKRMVTELVHVEIITTQSEAEALLLEANLIKKLKPRYNILLRDDKSHAYIVIRGGHAYPKLVKTRHLEDNDEAFGPFPSTQAVNSALKTLQRAFLLRSCTDSFFAHRDRPCLLYHIKRCSAPCVQKITQEAYDHLIQEIREFLKGKSQRVQDRLTQDMLAASECLDFERAATLRDRVQALNKLQAHQGVIFPNLRDTDVVALHQEQGDVCIQVFFFRQGWSFGNHVYFPTGTADLSEGTILSAFLAQYYGNHRLPREILLSHSLEDANLLQEALEGVSGHRLTLHVPQRGERAHAIAHALRNAQDALTRHHQENTSHRRHLEAVANLFHMDHPPERIEIYDNSHTQGSFAYGAMVVVDGEGFAKKYYRQFKIQGTMTAGDDYAMMREVLTRRFKGTTPEAAEQPDLVLIDGGKGHLSAALEALEEAGVSGVTVVGVSKGPDRNAGREFFHLSSGESFQLPENTPTLHFLQRLRDEAHRFAIGTHRRGRIKGLTKSRLDTIPGIGPRRKKALLLRFGSAQGVESASITEIANVEGINTATATTIYEFFHGR